LVRAPGSYPDCPRFKSWWAHQKGEKMSRIQKLKVANVKDDTIIRLKYSDGGNVVHCRDGFELEIIHGTYITNHLSEMVINPSLGNNHILQEMRSEGLLEDYERGSDEFEEYVAEVIDKNWQDYGWIETSTERYDHKRGYTEVSTVIKTTAGKIFEMADFELAGWDIEVDHPLGVLEIE
jgi:hypothetical protein